VADKDEKNKPATSATPGFNPKPVQLGGESIVDRLLPHMKKIVIAILVVAAVLTVIFTVRHFKERGRQKETAKLAKVLELGQREVRAPSPTPDPTPSPDPTFGSHKERALAVLSAMEKEGAKGSGVMRAALLVQAGQLDDAITEYKKHSKGKSLDAVLAREGQGIALEMKAEQAKDAASRQKGLEEALAAFKEMQQDEKGPRYAYALYHQGRLLGPMLLNRPAEAKAMLEKAKQASAEDEKLSAMIEERLASLGA
jgi:hypothetical protein